MRLLWLHLLGSIGLDASERKCDEKTLSMIDRPWCVRGIQGETIKLHYLFPTSHHAMCSGSRVLVVVMIATIDKNVLFRIAARFGAGLSSALMKRSKLGHSQKVNEERPASSRLVTFYLNILNTEFISLHKQNMMND
jgi:hypothetical protein